MSTTQPETDADEDERFDGHTHYFYDSNGHLYVDMTAVRERGNVEIVPIGSGEIVVDVCEMRVAKERPVINFTTSLDGDDALRGWCAETDE
jgi:hypothetical protein